MSKIIKLTKEHLDEIRKEFEETLRNAKMSDGKITYTKTFDFVQRKAKLYFTERAYMKMLALVREFDKEIAWHGLARRGDDPEKDEYIVYDILVYPQNVTGSEVTTDQVEYQMWMYSHDDETFPNIRMQGHSHVNMATSPSSVDNAWYNEILSQLDDTMFYIFLIWNKRNDKTIKIYDFAKNIVFETTDVEIEIIDDDTGVEKFLRDAKEVVHEKKYTPTTTTYNNPYQNQSKYGGTLVVSQSPKTDQPANIVVSISDAKKEPEKPEQKEAPSVVEKAGAQKKKKKKKKKGIIGFKSSSSYGRYDDDDDDYRRWGQYRGY